VAAWPTGTRPKGWRVPTTPRCSGRPHSSRSASWALHSDQPRAEDWGGEAELGQLISDAEDDLETTKFTLGTGVNEPQGLVVGASTTVTSASSGSFALVDLYSLEAAIPARFRPGSVLFGIARSGTTYGSSTSPAEPRSGFHV
jgi:hypothetical protein